ncbi:MAG: hypothetical protein WCK13_11180 [Ignavibacteriota bacterium]
MNRIIFAVLIFVVYTSTIYSQSKTDSTDFESNPQFRSIQIDASTIIFITKIGASIDFDLFSNRNKNSTWQSLGMRFGADRIWRSTVGGKETGSPFTNLNAITRLSIEGKTVRFDAFAGGAFQFATNGGSDNKDKIYLKVGADLKVKLTPNLGIIGNGALCSGSSFLGIGLYASFQ